MNENDNTETVNVNLEVPVPSRQLVRKLVVGVASVAGLAIAGAFTSKVAEQFETIVEVPVTTQS